MKRLSYLIGLIALNILVSGCIDEFDNTVIEQGEGPEIVKLVEANLHGRIYAQNNQPAKNVTVQVQEYTTETDIGGNFRFDNILLDEAFNLITFKRDNYFTNYKVTPAKAGQDIFVQAVMQTKLILGTFESSIGGTIGNTNRTTITFEPNSIIDSNGNVYEGDVRVFERLIKQEDPLFTQLTPGNLTGINNQDEDVILESYAMAAIELQSMSGEELNIKTGSEATLSFPISAQIIGMAPETIPLWYFDEVFGIWVEEGSAQMIDGRYVGQVSHFSFWNCDLPRKTVKLAMTLTDNNGIPYANAHVQMKTDEGLFSGFSYTDSDGYICGVVPADVGMTVLLYFGAANCVPDLTADIPPLSDDTDLGPIVIDGTLPPYIVRGRVVDCVGSGMPNIDITLDTREFVTIKTDQDGYFTFNLGPCLYGGNYHYQSYDAATKTYSRLYGGTISNLSQIEDLGDVVHCYDDERLNTIGAQCCLDTDQVDATMEWIDDDSREVTIIADDGENYIEIRIRLNDRFDLLMPSNVYDTYFEADGFNSDGTASGGGGEVYMYYGRGLPGEQISGEYRYDWDDDLINNPDFNITFNVIIEQ